MTRTILLLFLVAFVCLGSVSAQAITYNFASLDYPGAGLTDAFGIDGANIVGLYVTSYTHGFLFDGINYTALNYPSAVHTSAAGIDGTNIVGWYMDASGDHGFLFDGINYTALNYPGAVQTRALGIDGGDIVGDYADASGDHGFLFDGINYTPLDYPGAVSTHAFGIDGADIVGFYTDASGTHGFLFDGVNYTPLDYPGAVSTSAAGIDGADIVGFYTDASGTHGFLFDGVNYTSLDYPGTVSTVALDIDGGNIVGFYTDASGEHGFLASPVVPNTPPKAICKNVTVPTDPGQCTANASVDNGSSDPDGDPIKLVQNPLGPYPLGTTPVTLTVTDPSGASATCNATVTVVDQEAPVIGAVSVSPNVLWPPNHQMVAVAVTANATDNCSTTPVCKIASVTSNEPVNGLGDGDTAPDWMISGNLALQLRAERSGKGSGRVYTLAVGCMDASGNSSSKTTMVTVPKSQGK